MFHTQANTEIKLGTFIGDAVIDVSLNLKLCSYNLLYTVSYEIWGKKHEVLTNPCFLIMHCKTASWQEAVMIRRGGVGLILVVC